MSRKKDSTVLKKAKYAFGAIAEEYSDVYKDIKFTLRAFIGKEKATELVTDLNTELQKHADVIFTKSGKVTMSKENRRDEAAINKLSKGIGSFLDEWEHSEDPVFSRYDVTVKEAITSAAAAVPPAVAKRFVNRRIDQLRKFFGDDSAYIAEMHKMLTDAGLKVSAKHRILDGNLDQLWEALKVTPKLKNEIAEALKDISEEGENLARDEIKRQTKMVLHNARTSKYLAAYYSATRSGASEYDELLQQLYDEEPDAAAYLDEKEYRVALRDYEDLHSALKHPKRGLTEGELEALVDKIAEFFKEKSGL